MEHFRSLLPKLDYPFRLTYADHFLGIGSCFVEQMAERLQGHKFSSVHNPHGIVFNPYSVALGLNRLIQPKTYTLADLQEHQGLWYSFEHHGSFSTPDPAATLQNIQRAQTLAAAQFQRSTVLLLTLGTANVWEHQQLQRIVSNCHKLPGSTFQRRRMSVAEIVDTLGAVFHKTVAALPQIKVILTVSPVRYLREGVLENNRSKASLILAAEQLCHDFASVHYFPAYELLMDDLRDYRFYAPDLAHPSPQAIEYIWDYFKSSFFDAATQAQMQAIEKLQLALQHRPLHPNTSAHQTFLQQQLLYLAVLEKEYPALDFSSEKSIIHQQLKA
jgi:hypothetical protein